MALANILAGWLAMMAGVLSGAVAGLFFHRDDWMGGYNSYRRRLVRLGHISFFGLGFVNLFFAITAPMLGVYGTSLKAASISFIAALITMPLCCFLSAWRKPFRHLFPIPVTAAFVGISITLLGRMR
jgi:hypothetical protein